MKEPENSNEMFFVRIYLTEGEKRLKRVLALLHDEHRVQGVTVFRGITGFGRSGAFHSSSLIDISMDLPLAVEFFDDKEKVMEIISLLKEMIEPEHIVYWPAFLPV